MLTVERGGRYYRVADPSWQNPFDGRYAAVHGARWTAPGSHPTVYLCATVPVARANVNHNFAGLPYGPEDMDPRAAPVLLTVHVRPDRCLDVTGPAGAQAVGLPATYPKDAGGNTVTWAVCQPIGAQAHSAGLPAVACLSAVAAGEELAHFNRDGGLEQTARRRFDVWFWPRR